MYKPPLWRKIIFKPIAYIKALFATLLIRKSDVCIGTTEETIETYYRLYKVKHKVETLYTDKEFKDRMDKMFKERKK